MTNWTDEDIRDYYDRHWNLTLTQLSVITGKSVDYLKKFLLPSFS